MKLIASRIHGIHATVSLANRQKITHHRSNHLMWNGIYFRLKLSSEPGPF